MTIWKKAISAVTSAALLASLLATAVAPAAFAAATATTPATTIGVGAAAAVPLGTVTIGAPTDIAVGTLTLTLPAGYTWNAAAVITTTVVTTGTLAVAASPATTVGGTTATFAVTGAAAAGDTIAFSGPSVLAPAYSVFTPRDVTLSGLSSPSSLVVAKVWNGPTAACPVAYPNGLYGFEIAYCTDVKERKADGASFISLRMQNATTHTVTTFSVTGGTFIGGTNAFAGKTGTSVSITVQVTAGSLLYLASTTAGDALVTVQYSDGAATTDSITTFKFTAAASTTVSTAFSTTSLSASTATAVGGSTGVTATTTVRDPNNVAIPAGVTVRWTLTGPAYWAGSLTADSGSFTASSAGIAVSPLIYSTGVAGAVTVATTVKYLNVDYVLASKTLTLVGPVKKVVASNSSYSIAKDNSGDTSDELFVEVWDASDQSIANGVTFTLGAYTPGNIFAVDFGSAAYDTTDKGYYLDVDCIASGSATVTIKAATTAAGTTTTVTSEAVKFTCATPISAANPGTLDLQAGATAVAANSSVPINATVKDKDGLPAPDGTVVTAVTNGVGTVFSSKGLSTKGTVDGVSKFTYFAPANSGSGTVTVFATNTVPTSKSVTLLIGPTGSGVAVGMAESALGVTTTGPWSKSTKVANLNGFITFRINAGVANAGKTVGIFIQTKNSAGVWSAPTRLTARVADSKGNAFFNWRSSSALWVSVKGGLGSVGQTNPVQGRWQ